MPGKVNPVMPEVVNQVALGIVQTEGGSPRGAKKR
jgi:aspartate ammonia-lyase